MCKKCCQRRDCGAADGGGRASNMKVCYKIHNGSIRGVEHLVKDRINLFSSDDAASYESDSSEADEADSCRDKIVVYTTSLGFVRKTRSDCIQVKKLLRCLMLKTEERDILDQQFRREFVNMFKGLSPPQVIIRNRHVGGLRELEQIVESGKIIEMTSGIEKVTGFKFPCFNCAGYGYTNCSICLGSCRSKTIRIGSTRELSSLKCTFCNDGLIRCLKCLDIIH